MTTCIIVAAIVTCTNLQPTTPKDAARVLTSSVRPWVAPPPKVDWLANYSARPAPNPYWPFNGPPSPTKPLSAPWSVSTYSDGSTTATFFNGQQITGVPLLVLPTTKR